MAVSRGFVPLEIETNVAALSAFVVGTHHGLWMAGIEDAEWGRFSAWHTQQEIAVGNEDPLNAVARLAPTAPLKLFGLWIEEFRRSRASDGPV